MKEGWTYKKLGEVATNMYRGSGIKRDQVTKEGMPCVRYGEIYTTYNVAFDSCVSHTKEEYISSPKYFEHGDLLFAITGESVEDIGKTIAYLGHEKCLCGGDIVCMKHQQNPKFLSYALSTPDAIRQKGIGKTKLKVVHTNIPSLSEIRIPLPPLSEQQAIVTRLDSAFAQIDALKANAEKQLKEARKLFQAELTEAMKPGKEWGEKKMSDLYDVRDGTHDSPKYHEIGYPLVTSKNLKGGILDMSNVSLISEEDYNAINNRSKVDIGDVLFAMIGTIGNPVYVQTNPNYAIKNMALFKVPPTQSGEFLRYYLLNDNVLLKMQHEAKGTTQKFVSLGYLRNCLVRIPNLSDQRQIVSYLDSLSAKVHELEELLQKTLAECDALKQAMLREVFE